VVTDFNVGQPDPLFDVSELADVRKFEISPDGSPERKNRESGKKNTAAFHLILLV
jgi:hypothetical protein